MLGKQVFGLVIPTGELSCLEHGIKPDGMLLSDSTEDNYYNINAFLYET